MISLKKIRSKVHTLTSLIENPKLIPLRKYGIGVSEYCFLNQPWFKEHNFSTIIDIGSNQGQFALMINAIFPEAQLYCFEPIPDCYSRLINNTSKIKKISAFNIGLGDDESQLDFEANEFSGASSFLSMSNLHKITFPYTQKIKKIAVPIRRLDSFANELAIDFPLLIKVDVQGYEAQVLSGGKRIFQQAKAIIIETSFAHLYEGQPLFDEVYSHLKSLGFIYSGSIDQMHSPVTGAVLQSDSIFLRA